MLTFPSWREHILEDPIEDIFPYSPSKTFILILQKFRILSFHRVLVFFRTFTIGLISKIAFGNRP